MLIIHQGDDLMIPFKIEQNSDILTPNKFSDIRICIGDVVRSYSKGELVFNNECYLFHLKSNESASMLGLVECQVETTFVNNEIHSNVFTIKVLKTKKVLL